MMTNLPLRKPILNTKKWLITINLDDESNLAYTSIFPNLTNDTLFPKGVQ